MILLDDQSQFVADAVLREFNSLRSKISSAEFMQWDDPRAVVYVETLKNVFITITKQNRSSGENVSTVSSKSMLFLLAVAASGIECYTTKLLGYSLDNVERCSSVDMNAVVAVTEQNCSIEPSILLSALEVIAKVSVNSESSSEIVASTEGVPTALEELSNSHVIGLSAVIVRGALVLLPHAERNKANYLSSILLSWLNHRSNSIRLSASHGLALVSMRSNLDFVSNLNRLLRNKMGFITNIIAEIGKRNIKKQQDAELFTVSGAFLTTALIVKTHLLFLNDISSVDLATRNEVLRLGDNYLKYLDLVFNSQSDENVATLQQVILAAFETVFLIASYPISVEKVEKESEDNELFLQKLALLLPKMSLFISNSDPAVSSRSIEAVTMLCLRMDNDGKTTFKLSRFLLTIINNMFIISCENDSV